ncbi:hypothetical protein [Planctomycetes bacterium Pan216]|uniref:hypothetical protein n=1 Tax=Kolteria novifilia TaxID=2527975 RepID=UPI0011A68654
MERRHVKAYAFERYTFVDQDASTSTSNVPNDGMLVPWPDSRCVERMGLVTSVPGTSGRAVLIG